MTTKSYNSEYLRGDETFDDYKFQAEYRKLGIDIPDALLFTPEMNVFVAKAERDRTAEGLVGKMNPMTQQPYTTEEAAETANEYYNKAIDTLSAMTNDDLRKRGA